MSSTAPSADRALISSLLATLQTPVPPSDLIPPALLAAINASHNHQLKLLIGPSSVRQTVEQLQDLREKETRQRERRRERDERGKGRVAVSTSAGDEEGGWVRGLPRKWPGAEEAEGGEQDEERERFATLRKRLISLQAELKRKQARLEEYKSLAALASGITPEAVAAHDLAATDSDLSQALDATADLLPSATDALRANESTFVAAKRRRLAENGRRGGGAPVKQVKLEGQSAGAALLGMF